jgi:hypothetical protein
MVQEMAKQHLNIETQLNKRGKRSIRGQIVGVIQKSTQNNIEQKISNIQENKIANKILDANSGFNSKFISQLDIKDQEKSIQYIK